MLDFVICPICGNKYKMLNHSHLEKHGLTTAEFLEQYPTSSIYSEILDLKMSEIRHNAMTNYNKSEASRIKASEHCKKLNQDKERQRNKQKKLVEKMYYTERDNYEDSRLSQTKAWFEGRFGHKNKYYLKTGEVIKLDSFLEQQIVKFFEDHDIKFEHETLNIPYEVNNKSHVYYPDFYIPEVNMVIEGKGSNKISDELTQIKAEAAKSLGYNYMFITEFDIKDSTFCDRLLALLIK